VQFLLFKNNMILLLIWNYVTIAVNLEFELRYIKNIKYCDGFAQSFARQWLGKHPTTNVHATIGRVFSIASEQPSRQ
jgi:hypothetical protein